MRDAEWPQITGGVALGRAHVAVKRNQALLVRRIFRSDAGGLVKVKRPEDERFVMPRNSLGVTPMIGFGADHLVFVADEGPELPSFEAISMPQMHKRIDVVVSHHVAFSALNVDRHHHKLHFIAKKPILQMPVKGNHRGIVLLRNRRTLLKINGEERKPAHVRFRLCLAPGKAEKLKNLKPIFRTESVISQHRVNEIEFREIDLIIQGV